MDSFLSEAGITIRNQTLQLLVGDRGTHYPSARDSTEKEEKTATLTNFPCVLLLDIGSWPGLVPGSRERGETT